MKMRTFLSMIVCILVFAAHAEARIGIIVNKDLYPSVQDSVQKYISEMHVRGHQTWLQSSFFDASSSAGTLRYYLGLLHRFLNLKGVVFIGDLPIAEYEIENDFNYYGYRSFPIDLYYMDLDGQWLDNALDGDWGGHAQTGIFDGHQDGNGDRTVEIWVSRLTASATPGLGSEADVINAYFDRLKTWMDGDDGIDHKLLIFGDDEEWSNTQAWGGAALLNFAAAETSTYFRSNGDDTDSNWMAALRDGQQYALITEHSSPTYHAMLNGFSSAEYLNMPSSGAESDTRFYNLFACSISRYTILDFLGGLYAWGHNGLISIGSTKTGAMLDFNTYNTQLGWGDTFGEAFKHWLNHYVLAAPVTDGKISWHYGMTLSGVGTLTLDYQPQCFDNLPNPVVTLESRESSGGFTRFKLDVTNANQFPDALFAASPHLPACGLNTNSSRTWVKIYDNTGRYIYGFCALGSAASLNNIWFAIKSGQPWPGAIYVVLDDRECDVQYTSNMVNIW